MSSAKPHALILAGGGGTRLWPASRRRRPKQLLSLGARESLLAATFRRACAEFGLAHTFVVTAADQATAIRAALPDLPRDNLVSEVAPRNTAAAVALGATVVGRRAGPDAVLAVLPSDAYIGDEQGFARVVRLAAAHAKDAMVTIGIATTRPETGFGYLQLGPSLAEGVHEVARFVEKPGLEKAREYHAAPDYFWNSGMFFFTVGLILDETRRHLPELGQALDEMQRAPDFEAAASALYPRVPSVSIDYGIMEKASGIRVVPGSFGWNDVGSWAALSAIHAPDESQNVVVGDAVIEDGRGNIILGEPGAPLIGIAGISNMVVVATKDAVLVIPKDRAQDVRLVVAALKRAGRDDLL